MSKINQTLDEFLKEAMADQNIMTSVRNISVRLAAGPIGDTVEEELARIDQFIQDEKDRCALAYSKIDRRGAVAATKAKRKKNE